MWYKCGLVWNTCQNITTYYLIELCALQFKKGKPNLAVFYPLRFSAALQEASQVDKLIEEETGGEDVLEDRLPLLGVPFTVKEAFALQGTHHLTQYSYKPI